jgi:uncharacterized protein (TIGR02147 family)
MRHDIELDTQHKLAQAPDYRSFIKILIAERDRVGSPMSYADIADFAGFKSRSFPRDVILGVKSITLRSLPKFVRGLRLNRDCAALFVALVENEQPECRTGTESARKREQRLQRCRNILLRRGSILPPESKSLLKKTILPKVYAALSQGTPGDSLDVIAKRAQLEEAEVNTCLNFLLERGIVATDKLRWYTRQGFLDFSCLTGEHGIQELFCACSQDAQKACVTEAFQNPQNLFLASCIRVPSKEMPALRSELRDLLARFLEQSENTDGDKVVTLTCSFL